MQQYLIYEESPPFEEVLIRLKWLQGQIRLKKENISLEEVVKMAPGMSNKESWAGAISKVVP